MILYALRSAKTSLRKPFCFLAAVVLLCLSSPVAAQDLTEPPPTPNVPSGLPIASRLFDAQQEFQGREIDETVIQELNRRRIKIRSDGMARVHIQAPEDASPVPPAVVESFGGEMIIARHGFARVPISQLSALAQALPEGYSIRPINVPHADDEGPERPTRTRTATTDSTVPES